MIISLYIFIALVLVGLILKMTDRFWKSTPQQNIDATQSQECCGMHVICERDSLLSYVSSEIEYFEDEELDAFVGRGADEYTAEETEMFREILLTLRPEEIAAWGRSVQLRGIELPSDVRDELLMIVSEARAMAPAI